MCNRPGEGGKLDLGRVLVDAGSFSLNTSTSRIYTAENLTLSPGPAMGAGGHVEVAQPRGTAFLDVRSWDASSAAGAEINLKSSGPRRKGAGDYTVAVSEDGAFAISVGRPAASTLAQFEAVKPAIVVADEFIQSFNMSVNETSYLCASAQWFGWAETLSLNETWLLLNDSAFVADILNRANVSNVSSLVHGYNLSNGSNGTNSTITEGEILVDSFFYSFVNETFLCLEQSNHSTTTTVGAVVREWVASTPLAQVALTMFQLHYNANQTLPAYRSQAELGGLRRQRRMLQQAQQQERASIFQFGELTASMGTLNMSSWGAGDVDYIQNVYSGIEHDADAPLLTVTRENGAVVTGALSADTLAVQGVASLGNLLVDDSDISSVQDISLTPGTGKLQVDKLTVDDSTITATDSEVPLVLASPAGIAMDTEGDFITSASGSYVVGADTAEWDLVSTLRTVSADVISQVQDTATLSTGG